MDEVIGTDTAPVTDSVAQETPASTDTATAPEQSPDYAQLVSQIEKDWEKIPETERAKLDKRFQPAFTRRNNFLNQNLENGFKSADIPLPEGKTALDLVTEGDGRGLGEYFRSIVKAEVGPVQQVIQKAEFNQNLQTARDLAIADMPELRDHLEKAIPIIEGTPDLLKYVTDTNGRGLYRALQSVGVVLENQRLKGILEQNKIATKTANGTTRAGAGAPKQTSQSQPKTVKEAAAMAMKQIKADMDLDA